MPFDLPRHAYALLAAIAVVAIGAAGASGDTRSATQPAATSAGLATAIFAGGCFWCVEADFDKVEGVVETTSGYTGGHTRSPTYEQVSSGGTGHVEAVRVRFDPNKVTYRELVEHYWRSVDVLDGRGQFCDRGPEYRPVIFTAGDEQRLAAVESKSALEASGRFAKPIAVEIRPAATFTPAEEEHQDYASKNPLQYRYYRWGCRRDARLERLWGASAGH